MDVGVAPRQRHGKKPVTFDGKQVGELGLEPLPQPPAEPVGGAVARRNRIFRISREYKGETDVFHITAVLRIFHQLNHY
jgi:hypothetical protein